MLGSVYLWAVALISIAVLAILASTSQGGPTPLGLASELVLLGAIAQHFPLPIGPQHKVDTSIAVYFACVLLFDTPAAVVVVGVSQVLGQATLALRRVPGTGKRMRGARGVLFNTSQLVLATVLCSLVYNAVLPHAGPAPLERPENLWAIPTAALAMHLANSVSVAVMVGLQLQQRPREVLLSVWHGLILERAGLFLIGLVAALAGSRYPGAPLVMALPAGILFLSQRRALRLLAGEQHARAEAERAQAHVSLLANASAALAASLDYQTTLQSAVDLAIPALADSCSISIGRGDAASRWFSVAPGERVQQQRLDELLRHSPSAPWVDGGARSELYPVVSDELFTRWALDPGCLQLFRELGPVSAMLVPLIARGQTLGGFALYATVSGRRYGSADLAVAEDMAQRIALAIDSAQLYEAERASRAAAEEAVARTSRLYEDQQRIVARLRELRGQLEAAERVRLLDDERERIARELHDRVEQTFFSIGLSVNSLLASLPAWPMESLRSPLAVIRNSAQQGAEDLRAAIFALTRAEVHDLELVRALWQLVREFQKRTGVEADLVQSGAERRAPPDIAEVLHAVAREGLSNVERHARATAVVVSLCFEPDAVTLTVHDDGVGASALVLSMLADSATRFGLNGSRDRVLRLGGTFTAGPGDDEGFVLRVRLPLRDAAAP